MDNTAYNIEQLLRISIPFIAIFFIIPLIFCRKAEAISLKIVKGFCIGTFCSVIMGCILSFFKCFNYLYILITFPLIIFIVYYFVEETRVADFKNIMLKFSLKKMLLCGSFISLFVVFLYIRGEKIFSSISLYYSDPFVHILFLKDFMNGICFTNAFYPQGYYAVLGIINKLSFTDPMDVVRLFGPIQSTVVLLTLYAIVLELTRNRYISLLAVIIPGLDSFGVFPGVFYRQILSLPQEYSMIFFLPIIFFACRYLTQKQTIDKKYFFICVCNALLIHANVALLAFLCFIGIILSALLLRVSSPKPIIKIIGIGSATALVGALPLIIWDAVQKLLYGSTTTMASLQKLKDLYTALSCNNGWIDFRSFIFGAFNPIKDESIWHNSLAANVIFYTFLLGLLCVFGRMLWRQRLLHRHFYILCFSISQLILFILYYDKAYGLPSIIYYERTAMALTLVTFVTIALLINEFIELFPQNFLKPKMRLLIKICTVIFALVQITWFIPPKEIKPMMLQYESALKAYIQIRDGFKPNSWTIVSPVEEYPLVLGYGAHHEISNLVNIFSLKKAEDRKTSLISMMQTKNVFVFVEKSPLLIWAVMPKDEKKLTAKNDSYRFYNNRYVMEKKAKILMEKYMKVNINTEEKTSIFFEDEDLVVYHTSKKVNY
ncbi:MAG: hypothetical protein ACM3KR_05935 [Deltaproteobacteria bacterium]